MEDDDGLRALAVTCLKALGVATLAAARAEEGQVHLRDGVDLLFCDVGLPGNTNGFALATEALILQPGLKVILCSGSGERSPGLSPSIAGLPILTKPYRPADLRDAVAAALAAP